MRNPFSREKSRALVARIRPGQKNVSEDEVFLIMSRAWQEDGVWNVCAWDLPVAVFGETFEEARGNFDEAIKTHFLGLNELGKVKSTINHLQRLADERGFYWDRLKKSEVAISLSRTESQMLCGAM